MSTALQPVKVLSWQAWGPGLLDREAWENWLPRGGSCEHLQAKPPCKDAPPMLRRRYSMPSRMMLEVSIAACRQAGVAPDAVHLIFGSANGEIKTLGNLLNDLADSQQLSPTAFSNSVHHVPTGHFGMVVKHKLVSRTLSAFEDTFACCFLEANCLLQKNPQLPALIVIADEIPPDPFDKMLAVPPFPYAVAMLLGAEGNGREVRFRMGCDQQAEPAFHQEPAFDFLRWLISDRSSLHMNTHFGVIAWNK